MSQTSAEQHLPATIKHLPTPRRGGACSEGATGALATGQGHRTWPLQPASPDCRDGRGSPLRPHPWSAHSPALSVPPWGQGAAHPAPGRLPAKIKYLLKVLFAVCLSPRPGHHCSQPVGTHVPKEHGQVRSVGADPSPHWGARCALPTPEPTPPPPHHLEGGSASLAQSWSRGFLRPPRRPRPKPGAVERGGDRAGPESGGRSLTHPIDAPCPCLAPSWSLSPKNNKSETSPVSSGTS